MIELDFEINSKKKIAKFENFLEKHKIEFKKKTNTYKTIFCVEQAYNESDNIFLNYYILLQRR